MKSSLQSVQPPVIHKPNGPERPIMYICCTIRDWYHPELKKLPKSNVQKQKPEFFILELLYLLNEPKTRQHRTSHSPKTKNCGTSSVSKIISVASLRLFDALEIPFRWIFWWGRIRRDGIERWYAGSLPQHPWHHQNSTVFDSSPGRHLRASTRG